MTTVWPDLEIWANFHSCKWPNSEQIILPSGHTGREAQLDFTSHDVGTFILPIFFWEKIDFFKKCKKFIALHRSGSKFTKSGRNIFFPFGRNCKTLIVAGSTTSFWKRANIGWPLFKRALLAGLFSNGAHWPLYKRASLAGLFSNGPRWPASFQSGLIGLFLNGPRWPASFQTGLFGRPLFNRVSLASF